MTEARLIHRRRALTAGAAWMGATLAQPAIAQTGSFPDKPIRLVVAYPPGNSSDLVARFAAERLLPVLGQPVIVENRGGAGGTVGTDFIARQAPDGYVLGISNAGPLTIAPNLYRNLAYDPVRSFTQVAGMAIGSHLFVVNPSLPVTDIQSLIAYARANPGKIFYGSLGNGSTAHLAVALFAYLTGVELTHVPYSGSSSPMSDLLAGRVMMMSTAIVEVADQVRAGRLRALGVTSKEPSPFAPGVTPIAAQGVPDYDFYGWIGLMGPAGMPAPVAQKLNQAMATVTSYPEFVSKMAEMGLSRMEHTRAQLEDFIRFDADRWRTVIRAAGIQMD